MIERDLAHLRFLHTQVIMRGAYLNSDDLDFVIKKQAEITAIYNGIEEILETQRIKTAQL